MKPITKHAWAAVHERACDIVNASAIDDEVMGTIYREQLMEILDQLEQDFGPHPEIFDTRADFLSDPAERMRLYQKALTLARAKNDDEVIAEVLESISWLRDELRFNV